MKGRRITDTQWVLRGMMHYVGERSWRVVVSIVDLEKAYDSIEHGFLFAVLGRMGFPGRSVGWARALYDGAQSRVLVKGVLGGDFWVEKSVVGDNLKVLGIHSEYEGIGERASEELGAR